MLNWLTLTGLLFGLAGSAEQVLAKAWLKHNVGSERAPDLPAGAKGVSESRSRDHYDVIAFMLIGAGFAYLIMGQAMAGTTPAPLLVSLPVLIGFPYFGLSSYVAVWRYDGGGTAHGTWGPMSRYRNAVMLSVFGPLVLTAVALWLWGTSDIPEVVIPLAAGMAMFVYLVLSS